MTQTQKLVHAKTLMKVLKWKKGKKPKKGDEIRKVRNHVSATFHRLLRNYKEAFFKSEAAKNQPESKDIDPNDLAPELFLKLKNEEEDWEEEKKDEDEDEKDEEEVKEEAADAVDQVLLSMNRFEHPRRESLGPDPLVLGEKVPRLKSDFESLSLVKED